MKRIVLLFISFGMFLFALNAQETPPNPTANSQINWLSSITYNVNGDTESKGISYFNSLGKPTQSQSWDRLENKIWASEVLYDELGRPTLRTLSAPIGSTFGLDVQNFIRDNGGSVYDQQDISNNSQVSTTSKLGAYYFNNNYNYFDNTRYPFSRSVYSELNPGTVLKVNGGNKVNGEWLQSYRFSMPASRELSASNAFGLSIYNDRKISKMVNRDVNGIETVIFQDGDRNILATARSGNEDGINPTIRTNNIKIGKQGYVDIHIPHGVSGTITLSKQQGVDYNYISIKNLITENSSISDFYMSSSTNGIISSNKTLSPGIHRISIKYFDSSSERYLQLIDKITISHKYNYYDYSLNTYDKSGRLRKSTQPLSEDLKSTYKYNSLGQLIETSSPDEGEAKFKYREDGQIRFSQNSKQAQLGEVSFTDYDKLGRPIRSGVCGHDFTSLNPNTSIVTQSLKELHYTSYDEPSDELANVLAQCNIPSKAYKQTFLYGNVSMTKTELPTTNKSWYSYDVYGRVKWIVQDVEELDCPKIIDYKYDPITGQVVEVGYQRAIPSERFIHRYEYDIVGQLIKVSTSINGSDFTENAEYKYTETGALKRIELAEDLQGVDYVYNFNGQLKAINSPLSSGFKDPGNDSPGTNGFKNDVFGMIIDYNREDYIRVGNHVNGLNNTAVNPQLNGNIGSTRWFNGSTVSNTNDTYSFDYNKNNWMTQATFGSTSTNNGNSNFAPNLNKDYKVSNITYDANGNIQTLKRTGNTDSGGNNDMDDFTYHYDGVGNKLESIEDSNDNSNPNRFADLKNQYDPVALNSPFGGTGELQGNYLYNDIGQLITNMQDEISYKYNPSGLVKEITKFAGTNTGNWASLYTNSYTDATHSDTYFWNMSSNANVGINYGNYKTILGGPDCNALVDNYDNTLSLNSNGIAMIGNPGLTYDASLEFNVIPNKLHKLNLDIIGRQLENIRKVITAPGDPIPPPPEDSPIGYLIEILNESNQVIGTTSYNYPNPVMINDSDLNNNEPCVKFYDKSHSFTFTPTTEKIKFKISVKQAVAHKNSIYLDNLNLQVAEAPALAFYYNDRGHRVRKETYDDFGNTSRTIYVRDLAGNPLGIYEESFGPSANVPESLKELPVYGSSRLGIYYRNNSSEGTYAYQITDHLGNVRAVVLKDGQNALSLTNKTDYYPFGMPMPNRNIEDGYRYGYQGEFAEKEPELGQGFNSFQLRLYDARIGRWISPDPYGEFFSPYLANGNNPLSNVDPSGGCTNKRDAECVKTVLPGTSYDADGIAWNHDGTDWYGSHIDLDLVIVKEPFSIIDWVSEHAYFNADASIDFGTNFEITAKALGGNISAKYKKDVNPLIKLGLEYDKSWEFTAVPGGPNSGYSNTNERNEWAISGIVGVGQEFESSKGFWLPNGDVKSDTSNWIIISVTEEYHTHGIHKGLVKNRKFGWSFGGGIALLLGANADLSFGLQFETDNK